MSDLPISRSLHHDEVLASYMRPGDLPGQPIVVIACIACIADKLLLVSIEKEHRSTILSLVRLRVQVRNVDKAIEKFFQRVAAQR
jgi:hypothetical protein